MKITDWFVGYVENVNDPREIGRVQVRALGYHTQDREQIPTEDLPWATCISPVDSAGFAGVGKAAVGLVEGSMVMGFFRDGSALQEPVVMGSISSITGLGNTDVTGERASFIGNDGPQDSRTVDSLFGPSKSSNTFAGGLYGNFGNGSLVPPTSSFEDSPDFSDVSDVGDRFIEIARSQLNVVETSNNQGVGIQKYWGATSYPGGYANREPWCAAFASWVVKTSGAVPGDMLPNTASAFAFEKWAKRLIRKGVPWIRMTKSPREVKKGDIVIYSYSHIGFVSEDSQGSTFVGIDGNTARGKEVRDPGKGGVAEKRRNLSTVRSAIRIE